MVYSDVDEPESQTGFYLPGVMFLKHSALIPRHLEWVKEPADEGPL
jgi:hypothetical protein